MATAKATISGAILGLRSGSRNFSPAANTYSAANGTIQLFDLASGANTITVPSGAHAALILPPAANAVALTLKGVSGDTGIAMAKTQWTFLPFSESAPPANFVINAGATVTGMEIIWL